MSGGSFNYLCNRSGIEIIEDEEMLDSMIESLKNYDPGADKAVVDSQAVLADARRLRAELAKLDEKIEPLRAVWRAVEWHHSFDCGPEDVQIALSKFNEKG